MLKYLAVPYYRIHLFYTDASPRTCMRQHPAYNIEFVNRYFLDQLKKNNKGLLIRELEAVMVSKNSKDVKEYISSQVRKGFSNI